MQVHIHANTHMRARAHTHTLKHTHFLALSLSHETSLCAIMQRKQRSETQMKITLNSIILYTETKIFVVNKSLSQLPFNIDYTTEKNFETVLTNR